MSDEPLDDLQRKRLQDAQAKEEEAKRDNVVEALKQIGDRVASIQVNRIGVQLMLTSSAGCLFLQLDWDDLEQLILENGVVMDEDMIRQMAELGKKDPRET